jgi:hypothetical protein
MSKDTAGLLKLVEEAAREGDLEKVRKLIAVADVLEEQATGNRRPITTTAVATPSAQPTAVSRPASRRLPLFGIALGYATYNALATAHAYRVASAEADAVLAKGGADLAEVTLHMRSLGTTAEVQYAETGKATEEQSGDGGGTSMASTPARQVFVLPHVYISDALFGRSSWFLTCKKRMSAGGTTTEYSSRSDTGKPGISIDFGSERRGR